MTDETMPRATLDKLSLVEVTTELVAAYVSRNHVRPGDLPGLITSVHMAFDTLDSVSEPEVAARPMPLVPIKKTITDEALISLEDGKRYKTLKRHLGKRGLTPEAYRAKWGLPHDYPMVAPAYARQRSALAKEIGLGSKRRKP